MTTNNMAALRDELFASLRAVKAGEMDLDRAKAVNEISKTLIDSAKVEVEFLRTTGGQDSPFIEQKQLPAGIVGITRHRLA